MYRLLYLICLCLPLLANAQSYSLKGENPKVVIDVRTPQEFAAGHVNGAINIPYDEIEANGSTLARFKKDDNILVYCKSGRRSEIARQTLTKLGFSKVRNGGGMNDLLARLKVCPGTSC